MSANVTATELARNLGDVLARVRYRGESFVVRKNGKVIARIEPAERQPSTSLREAFAAWISAAPSDVTFAEDVERVNNADAPANNPWAL
jgi:prevent-host-death family protein